MTGSSFAFPTRSILFRTSTTGTTMFFTQAEQVLLAAARLLRRVEHDADEVDIAHRLERGVDHAHVHAVRRLVNAGRVDEHDLAVLG